MKIRNAQAHNPTQQRQINHSIDHGLQTRWTKGLPITKAAIAQLIIL